MKKGKRHFFTTFLFSTMILSISAQKTPLIADGAEITLVASDYKFTEGPAVDKEGNVFFTDQPNDRIIKWSVVDGSVSVFMEPSGRANGLYFDRQGNLVACADEKFQLWRIDPKKNVTVLVDGFEGKNLNGPNDLWIDLKGGTYFTDPFYKRDYWERTEKDIQNERVYYLTPDMDKIKIVANDFERPNGIVGSPDGKILYVSDIGAKKTYSYSISEDGYLTNKQLFADMGSDGMTLDNQGNVYLTGNGVTVFNSMGEQIQHIPIDQKWTANVTFGGKDQKTLFITAMNSLYTLQMNVHGVTHLN
ncbi:SMP-30/gluconolactonase/LRE family protein [Kriegella aquimaris]|uniref:Gluconolactonase n=1 Tax=Kriegella aquimaris TaxID=192904 RepID=A0A1G9YFB0_9FLAO|nr:SMP-30/gluconolactonase/LRE family protein [Kriegella aquimaris]SDN07141.1 gluconolactonase [Kriegella aquimaris]